MIQETAKQPESPHMKDFSPPWRHFRYEYNEKLMPRREMIPPGQHGDGCMLRASGLVTVYANSMFTNKDGNAWNYAVELGKEKQTQKIASGIVYVKEGENASEKVLKAAWEQMLPVVQAFREGARNLYFCMLGSAGWPEDPSPINPVPDAWYPAKLYVPEDERPVTVAWTDIFNLEHLGDRTAIYKEDGWHWAHGDQNPVSDSIRITDWTACPEAPDYPLDGKEAPWTGK